VIDGGGKMNNNKIELSKLVNTQVTISGVAFNKKDGAIIKSDSGMVFVGGLSGWPDGYHGSAKIKVNGLLKSAVIPKAETNENGEISQGYDQDTTIYTIEDPKWSVE
jgi:hypothetical protein